MQCHFEAGMLNHYSVYSASNVRRLCSLLCPAISFPHFHVLQFHALHIGQSISRPSFSRPAFSAPPIVIPDYRNNIDDTTTTTTTATGIWTVNRKQYCSQDS